MSETATATPARPKAPRQAGHLAENLPATGKERTAYLLEKGWTPMGDSALPDTLWYAPGFRLLETYEKVSEPMTGEVERYEAGKQALLDGKISHNPEPRRRNQVRCTPASRPLTTAEAYRRQVELDLLEREKALRAQMAAEGSHVG